MVTRSALRAACFLLRAICAIFICAAVCSAQESTIGPSVQLQELTASDGVADEQFGNSIAVSGNVAVVGAIASNSRQGAAYVFVRSSGMWRQQAELIAPDGEAGDQFGIAVAVDRGTIVVGADCHPAVGATGGCGPGAAYVFVESDGMWSQQAELTPFDGAPVDLFGSSVAVSGSRVVVGSPQHVVASISGPNSLQGSAYVFARSGGTWSQRAELTASDGAYVDFFGSSVAVDHSTIVVGSPCHLYHDNCGLGAAYVFVESDGMWSQQAELTASDGVDGDAFGWSVAVSSSRVVVGAPCNIYLDDTCQDAGQAYVFVESGGTWAQQAKLVSSDAHGGFFGDQFGWSVAVSGSCVAVGSPQHAVGSNSSQGAAYMFEQSGTTWSQRAELIASDGAAYDFFGRSVAVRGCTILAGAPFHGVGSNAIQGAAYVFGIPPED